MSGKDDSKFFITCTQFSKLIFSMYTEEFSPKEIDIEKSKSILGEGKKYYMKCSARFFGVDCLEEFLWLRSYIEKKNGEDIVFGVSFAENRRYIGERFVVQVIELASFVTLISFSWMERDLSSRIIPQWSNNIQLTIMSSQCPRRGMWVDSRISPMQEPYFTH